MDARYLTGLTAVVPELFSQETVQAAVTDANKLADFEAAINTIKAAIAVKMPVPATRHTRRAWLVGLGWSNMSSMNRSGIRTNCAAMTPHAPRPSCRACGLR